MKRPRGRVVAMTAAIGIAALAVLIAVSWDDLVVHYHLRGLRAEPDRLVELIERSGDSLEGRAVRAFLDTPAGERAFVEEYARVVLASVLTPDVHSSVLEGLIWLGDGYASYFQWGRRFVGRYGIFPDGNPAGRLRALASALPRLDGVTFTSPDYPELEFTILALEPALDSLSPPFRREASSLPEPGEFVCTVRRTDAAALPILLQLLSDSFVTNRIDAAEALGRLGVGARDAVPALEAVVEEARDDVLFSPLVLEAVSRALEQIRAAAESDSISERSGPGRR